MIKFKPKSTTEKLFTKENVFAWIESLENAVIAVGKLQEICTDNERCDSCPFDNYSDKSIECAIFNYCLSHSIKNLKTPLEETLDHLYYEVESNKWEDDDV